MFFSLFHQIEGMFYHLHLNFIFFFFHFLSRHPKHKWTTKLIQKIIQRNFFFFRIWSNEFPRWLSKTMNRQVWRGKIGINFSHSFRSISFGRQLQMCAAYPPSFESFESFDRCETVAILFYFRWKSWMLSSVLLLWNVHFYWGFSFSKRA